MHRRDSRQDSLQKRFDNLSKIINEDDVLSRIPSTATFVEFSDDEDDNSSGSTVSGHGSSQAKSEKCSTAGGLAGSTPPVTRKSSVLSSRTIPQSALSSRESAYNEALKRISELNLKKKTIDMKVVKFPQKKSCSSHQVKPTLVSSQSQGDPSTVAREPSSSLFSSQTDLKFSPSKCSMRGNTFDYGSDKNLKKESDNILTIKKKEYNVLFHIGKGGSSDVFAAFDIECRKLVAIKCVKLGSIDKDVKEGYVREIQYLEHLKESDYVIKMLGYEYMHDKLYLVLEKADADLSSYLSDMKTKNKSLDPLTVRFYWSQMLKAVAEIHQLGVIHSDLKPANFVLAGGHLKLIDFGIAAQVPKDVTSIFRAAQCGTLNYISPEALNAYPIQEDRKKLSEPHSLYKINFKSDVWSLGCILYLMVYGHTPFHQFTSLFQKMNAIVNPDVEIHYSSNVQDPAVIPVLKMCLQRNPYKRASVDELLQHPFLKDLEQETPNTVCAIIREIENIEKMGPGHMNALVALRAKLQNLLDNKNG